MYFPLWVLNHEQGHSTIFPQPLIPTAEKKDTQLEIFHKSR